MIQKFVDAFMNKKQQFREAFASKHPDNYGDIVLELVKLLNCVDKYIEIDPEPDPKRIHTIDDGNYQGTLLYIIAEQGYQPFTYWCMSVSYGSCSGCDTLHSIRGYTDDAPTTDQLDQYETLALHLVQSMKQISGYGDRSED
jgi:hypothetical protein